jgi:hypothetical protein
MLQLAVHVVDRVIVVIYVQIKDVALGGTTNLVILTVISLHFFLSGW